MIDNLLPRSELKSFARQQALAELRKLLDSLHSNSQRGTASLKEMRREDANDTKEGTRDNPDEPAVL